MINPISNQGVPQPDPSGVGGRNQGLQGRANQRLDSGGGFMRGHMQVNGGDHRIDQPELTETEKAMLRNARNNMAEYLHDQAGQGGPVKVDGARISSEGQAMLDKENQPVGDGGAVSGGERTAVSFPGPQGGDGGAVSGGERVAQPFGQGDGGAARNGGLDAQPHPGPPPADEGPSGPTYTARRA